LTLEDCSPERLRHITRERGAEAAADALFDAVERYNGARPPVLASPCGEPRETLGNARMLVVPAALYRERPGYGGDGRLIRKVAAKFGVASELVAVSSVGGVEANAGTIRRELERRLREPTILVSLSKGSADLRLALESLDRPLEAPWVWIQICGLPRGTPYADVIHESRVRRILFGRFLARHGGSLAIVEEMRASAGRRLARPIAIPREIHVVNVVAFPRRREVAWHAKSRFRALSKYGPNDAGGLILDSLVLPGAIYAVRGADHFFRIDDAEALLERLFAEIAASGLLDRKEVAV
jgi:hypothetical protein